MAFINYFLVSIAASSGLICGYFLAKIAKEEVKYGIFYFQILKSLVLSSIIFFALSAYISPIIAVIPSALVLVFALSLKNLLEFNKITYIVHAVAFYLAYNNRFFALIASLIFIYGLPAGTLMRHNKEGTKGFVKVTLFFIAISLALLPLNLFKP